MQQGLVMRKSLCQLPPRFVFFENFSASVGLSCLSSLLKSFADWTIFIESARFVVLDFCATLRVDSVFCTALLWESDRWCTFLSDRADVVWTVAFRSLGGVFKCVLSTSNVLLLADTVLLIAAFAVLFLSHSLVSLLFSILFRLYFMGNRVFLKKNAKIHRIIVLTWKISTLQLMITHCNWAVIKLSKVR